MKLFCWNNYIKTEAWKHSINLKNASIICWSLVRGVLYCRFTGWFHILCSGIRGEVAWFCQYSDCDGVHSVGPDIWAYLFLYHTTSVQDGKRLMRPRLISCSVTQHIAWTLKLTQLWRLLQEFKNEWVMFCLMLHSYCELYLDVFEGSISSEYDFRLHFLLKWIRI